MEYCAAPPSLPALSQVEEMVIAQAHVQVWKLGPRTLGLSHQKLVRGCKNGHTAASDRARIGRKHRSTIGIKLYHEFIRHIGRGILTRLPEDISDGTHSAIIDQPMLGPEVFGQHNPGPNA